MHRPSWFRDGKVVVSYAPTAGINKDGEELYIVDPATGKRTEQVNDRLAEDVNSILKKKKSETLRWVSAEDVMESGIGVPVYYDERTLRDYHAELKSAWPDYDTVSLGDDGPR